MKQVLFAVMSMILANVACAQDVTTQQAPLPSSVPFAPPGTTVTTITTTVGGQGSQAAPAAAASATPNAPAVATGVIPAAPSGVPAYSSTPGAAMTPGASAAQSGVATGVLAPQPQVPGTVGLPSELTPPNQPSSGAAGASGAPTAHMIDPTLFGTLQDPAFQGMTGKMFPMTVDQIRALREMYETTKRVTAEPPRTPPKPLVSSQNVSLSPGTVPPVVRLANGYVSSIVFVDQTGAPWPITAYSIGNPQAFNIQWDNESNLLMIQGHGAYVSGNMAVSLKKLDTPIMLTLVSEQNVVDYRLDFRVQGRGPNANGAMIASTLPQNNNHILMNLLDGVPPSNARSLEVEGGQGQAWLQGSTMFLRTQLTVLSPSWQATMNSPDGTKVYQMAATPLVLVSDRGNSVPLRIKGL